MIFSFGTPINFLIGNHTPCVVTEDAFEYVLHGWRMIGAPSFYAMNVFRGDAIKLKVRGQNNFIPQLSQSTKWWTSPSAAAPGRDS